MVETKAKRLKLKPSQRDKKRYFVAKSSYEKIEKAILDYIGVLGLARSGLMRVKMASGEIFSCNRESLNEVRASMAFAKISIEKVSGTIKGLDLPDRKS